MNALNEYNRIFRETVGVSEDALNEDFTFNGVAVWDSVAHMSLISSLEDAFDVMFDVDDILHYGSYFHGIEILKHYGVEF